MCDFLGGSTGIKLKYPVESQFILNETVKLRVHACFFFEKSNGFKLFLFIIANKVVNFGRSRGQFICNLILCNLPDLFNSCFHRFSFHGAKEIESVFNRLLFPSVI